MSSEIQELITKLRKAEERRHVASLQAIDTLAQNMIGSGGPTTEQSLAKGARQAQERGVARDVSNVGRVLTALDTQRYKPLDDIMELTGLDEMQARSALYARSLQSRIQKRKRDKRMAFRLATEPLPTKLKRARAKTPSATDRVRALFKEHPEGLSTRQVRMALPDLKGNTVGTALYNMKKKSKELIYDEAAETYRLA